MSPAIVFVAGALAGTVLGLVFFGGLWWTSTRLARSTRPALLVAASLLGRMLVLALGLVVLARIDVLALVGGLAGMLATRIALTHMAANGSG